MEQFSVVTTDNLTLQTKSYVIENAVANILIIHGLGEHQNRYEHVTKAFNNAGFSCFTFDLRGHGQSEGKRGHTPSYQQLLDDVEVVLQGIKEKSSVLPQFIFGHSMGGNIAASYILRKKPLLHGAILSSPWFELKIKPPLLEILLAKIIVKFWPNLWRNTNLNPHFLSHDKQVVENYIKDPLVHGRITPSMFLSMKKAGDYILENASTFQVPLLITHGDEDHITSMEASQKMAESAGGEFHIWKGMYHEPHNEIDKNQPLTAYISWIKKQLQESNN